MLFFGKCPFGYQIIWIWIRKHHLAIVQNHINERGLIFFRRKVPLLLSMLHRLLLLGLLCFHKKFFSVQLQGFSNGLHLVESLPVVDVPLFEANATNDGGFGLMQQRRGRRH